MDSFLDFSDDVDDEDAAFLPDDFGLKSTEHTGAIEDDDDALFLPDVIGLENEFHHVETTPLGSVPLDYECTILEKNYEIKALTDHNTQLASMLERAQDELRSLKEKSDLSSVARSTPNEEELDGSMNEINKKRKIEDRQIDAQDRESIESNEFSIVTTENIALRKSIEDLQNEVKAFLKERTCLDDYINDSIVSMRLDLENFESQMNPPSSTDFAQIWADSTSPLNPSAKPDSTCSIAKIEALKSMHKSIIIVTGSVVDRESQEIDRLKNEINNLSMEYNHKQELIENYQKENLELKSTMNQVWNHAQSETDRLQRETEEKMRDHFFELRSKVEQVLHEKEVIVTEYNILSDGMKQLQGERDNAMNVAHTAIAERNELIEVMNKLEKEKENAVKYAESTADTDGMKQLQGERDNAMNVAHAAIAERNELIEVMNKLEKEKENAVKYAESTAAEKLRSFALKSKNGAAFEEMNLRKEIDVISGELEDYQERCYDLHSKLQEKSNDLMLCERQKSELGETLATVKKQSEEMFESLQHQLEAEKALKTVIESEFQEKISAAQLELDQVQSRFGQASSDCQTLQQQLLATKKDLDECLVQKHRIIEHSREDVENLKNKIRVLHAQLSLQKEEENKLVAKFQMAESALLVLTAEKTEILHMLQNSENFRDKIIQESALIAEEISCKDVLLETMRHDLKEANDEVEHLEILLLRSSSDFDRLQRLLTDKSMGWHECQLQSYINTKQHRIKQKHSANQIQLLELQLSKEKNQNQQVVSEKQRNIEELEVENSEILLELLESEKRRKSVVSENRTTRKHLALQRLQLETVLVEYNGMQEELTCLKAAYVHSSHSLNRMNSLLSTHLIYTQECQLQKYGTIKKSLHESQNSKENIRVLQIENESKQDTICRYKYVVCTLLNKHEAKSSEASQRLLECEADRNDAIQKSTSSAERLAQNNQVLEKIRVDYQESQEEVEYTKGLLLRSSSDFHRLQLFMSAQSLNCHDCQLQKYENTKQFRDKMKYFEDHTQLIEHQLSSQHDEKYGHQQERSMMVCKIEELDGENSEILIELLKSESKRKNAVHESRSYRKQLAQQSMRLEMLQKSHSEGQEEFTNLRDLQLQCTQHFNRMQSLFTAQAKDMLACQLQKFSIMQRLNHEVKQHSEDIQTLDSHTSKEREEMNQLQILLSDKNSTLHDVKTENSERLQRLNNAERVIEELGVENSEILLELLESESGRKNTVRENKLYRQQLTQQCMRLDMLKESQSEEQEELAHLRDLQLQSTQHFNRMQSLFTVQAIDMQECQLQKFSNMQRLSHEVKQHNGAIQMFDIHLSKEREEKNQLQMLLSDKSSILLDVEIEKSDMLQRLHNAEAALEKTLKDKKVAVENLEKLKNLFDMVLTECKERQEEVEDLMDMQLKTSSSFTRFQILFTAQSMDLHNCQFQKYERIRTFICDNTDQQRKGSIQNQFHLSEVTLHEVKSLECHQMRESSPLEEHQSPRQHARSNLFDYETCSASNEDPFFGIEALDVTMEIEFVADEESFEGEQMVSIQERCHDLKDHDNSAQVEYTKLKDDYNIQRDDFINLRKACEIKSKDLEASHLQNNELIKQHSKHTLMFKHDLDLIQLKCDWDNEEWRRNHQMLQDQLDTTLYELRKVNDLYAAKCSDFSQLEIRYEVKSKDLEVSHLQKMDLLKQVNEQKLAYQHDLDLLKLKIRWDSELSTQKNHMHRPGQTLDTDMNKLHQADNSCNSSLKEIEQLHTLCSKHLESISELQQQCAILQLDLETCQLQKYDLIQQHKSESLRWKEELRQFQIRKVSEETSMKNENIVMLKQVEADCNVRIECTTKEKIATIVSIERAMTELANQCESKIIENQVQLNILQAEADEYARHKARAAELENEYSNSIKTWMEKYQYVNKELEILIDKENKLKREHEEAINMAIQEVESLETENTKLVLEAEQKNHEMEKFKHDAMRRDLLLNNENSELSMESKQDPPANLDSMSANDENAFHDLLDVKKMPDKFEPAARRAPLCNLPNGQNVEKFELMSPMSAEFMSPLGVTAEGFKKKYTPLTDDKVKHLPMSGERSSTKKQLALSLQRSQISISSSGRSAAAKARPVSVPVASKLKDPRLNTRLPGPSKPPRTVLSTGVTLSPKQSVSMTKKSRLAASPSQNKSKAAVSVSNIPRRTAIPRCSRIGLNQTKG